MTSEQCDGQKSRETLLILFDHLFTDIEVCSMNESYTNTKLILQCSMIILDNSIIDI